MHFAKVVLGCLIGLSCTGSADAQIGLYGTFDAGKLNSPNTPWLYGGTVGLYLDHGHGLIATGFDARAEFLRHGGNSGTNTDTSIKSGLAGVRLAVIPHVLPLKPYAEGLVGGGHINVGQGSARTSTTAFEYKVLGGLDFTFFPRLDWRVVEFGYGGFSGQASGVHPKSVSTGIVFRLPI
jgi:hypothetical protein